MKKMERNSPPDCLNNEIENSRSEKIKAYDKIKESGKIKDLWNNSFSECKEKLLEMSDYTCAFCGVKIQLDCFDVEHYLPKSEFPFLAYCYDNYLPSCPKCNQRYKRNFFPEALKDKLIVESFYNSNLPESIAFIKSEILDENICPDRIIDPSFDNPEEHLEFDCIFHRYIPKTQIGERTNNMFFKRYKGFAEKLERINGFVKDRIKRNLDELKDDIVAFTDIEGNQFYYLKYFEFWKKELDEGRI